MNIRDLEQIILSHKGAFLDFPFGEEVNVYKVKVGPKDKMFALVLNDSNPLKISLKCDPQLAAVLRDRYESVMPGEHLNKKHWITILLTGQLSKQEVLDLILHSYNLVTGVKDSPDFN